MEGCIQAPALSDGMPCCRPATPPYQLRKLGWDGSPSSLWGRVFNVPCVPLSSPVIPPLPLRKNAPDVGEERENGRMVRLQFCPVERLEIVRSEVGLCHLREKLLLIGEAVVLRP